VNAGSRIEPSAEARPTAATLSEHSPCGCDAARYVCERGAQGAAARHTRARQADAARRASLATPAAHRHRAAWRAMPPPAGRRAEPPAPASPVPTSTLQRAAAMGPLFGGRLAAAPGGGFAAVGEVRDEFGVTMAAARGGIKHGDGLDFLRDRGGRGTVYGWIGGQEEGLRVLARGVGDGKGANHVQLRGLKQAPVHLWQGK
jgi:hypothetical protein